MVSSSIWGLAPNKVVEQELPLLLPFGFGGLPSSHQARARSTDSGKRSQKRPAILSAVSP